MNIKIFCFLFVVGTLFGQNRMKTGNDFLREYPKKVVEGVSLKKIPPQEVLMVTHYSGVMEGVLSGWGFSSTLFDLLIDKYSDSESNTIIKSQIRRMNIYSKVTDMSRSQQLAIAYNYIVNNPKERHEEAGILFFKAILDAY